MDIQYLLWLQDFRNGMNDAWTPFMEFVSSFAVDYLILIPVFLYWFWDKRKGLYALVSYYFCMIMTPLIKLTACIYRPWIRDSRVLPAGDSIRTATGYSFPSGHTSTAAPLAGGMAVNMWDNKRTRWLSFLFVAFILLTGFSRNYLGVHTPQDVFVGISESVFSLILTAKLFQYLDKHPEKEDWFLLGGFILCWIGRQGDRLHHRAVCGKEMDQIPVLPARLAGRCDLRCAADSDGDVKEPRASRDDGLAGCALGPAGLLCDPRLLLYRAGPAAAQAVRKDFAGFESVTRHESLASFFSLALEETLI